MFVISKKKTYSLAYGFFILCYFHLSKQDLVSGHKIFLFNKGIQLDRENFLGLL
jgi:hypothetical protein